MKPVPYQGEPVSVEEAREFCRAVLRYFPGDEDHDGGAR